LQIRLSPTGKPKAKSVKKKRGTGVAASRPDYPASTNVSSPIQAASRRRAKQTAKSAATLDLHRYEYENSLDDNFVVGDDEEDAVIETTEDEFEESFEPVRVKGKPRSVTKRPLGPPITIDEKIERLNRIHQIVVEDFLNTAKQQSQKVSQKRGLNYRGKRLRVISSWYPRVCEHTLSPTPFFGKWPSTFRKVSPPSPPILLGNGSLGLSGPDESELLEIPNIDPDKVERYGKTFLKIIKDAHREYEAMMQQQEDHPQDPNHQNVIDISSDDEYGDSGDLDELHSDEESQGERSQYFHSDDVNAFNAQRRCPISPSVRAYC